jgi:hypothetical protein
MILPVAATRAGRRLLRRPDRLALKTSAVSLKPAVVTAIVHLWVDSRPLSASIGEATITLLLLAVAAIGVVLGLGCEARRRKKGLLRPS